MPALFVTPDQAVASEAAKLEMVQIFENGAMVGAAPVVDPVCSPGQFDLSGTNPIGKDFVEGIALAVIRQFGSQPAPSWIAVTTFLNSWVNYGGSTAHLRYCKDSQGRVYISGSVKDGSSFFDIFVLPTGYRPVHDLGFAVESDAGPRCCIVFNTGAVQITSLGANTRVSIELTFRTDE